MYGILSLPTYFKNTQSAKKKKCVKCSLQVTLFYCPSYVASIPLQCCSLNKPREVRENFLFDFWQCHKGQGLLCQMTTPQACHWLHHLVFCGHLVFCLLPRFYLGATKKGHINRAPLGATQQQRANHALKVVHTKIIFNQSGKMLLMAKDEQVYWGRGVRNKSSTPLIPKNEGPKWLNVSGTLRSFHRSNTNGSLGEVQSSLTGRSKSRVSKW